MKTLIVALFLFIAAFLGLYSKAFAVVPWAEEVASVEFESDGSPFKLLGTTTLSNDRIGKILNQVAFLTCTSPDDPAYFTEEKSTVATGSKHLVHTHSIWIIESQPPVGLIQCVLFASFTTDPSHSHDGTTTDTKITIVP